MDKEMYEREGREERLKEIMAKKPHLKDASRINWRLSQDWEVPEWVNVKPVNKEEEKVDLGKRQRKKFVNYGTMSEQFFLQCVEAGKDPNEVLR